MQQGKPIDPWQPEASRCQGGGQCGEGLALIHFSLEICERVSLAGLFVGWSGRAYCRESRGREKPGQW
jgi:hypothetical protein